MTRALAAVDLGAQSGRVAVGRFDGEHLAVEEVHRFPNVPVENDGVLRSDAPRLWADVQDGLRKATRDEQIESVAVDSWGVDFGLIDDAGVLLGDPVHYRDSRRLAAFDAVLERVPARSCTSEQRSSSSRSTRSSSLPRWRRTTTRRSPMPSGCC